MIKQRLLYPLLRRFNEWFVFPGRTKSLVRCLRPHLQGSRSILDIGCSDGQVAYELGQSLGASVQGCDVHLQPECAIPVVKYDGRRLPFADGQFDTVLLADVLHHDLDPARVLAEALRVAADKVVLKDHYWENRRQWASLYFFDWLSNAPFGIALPYNFQRPAEWEAMFAELEAEVAENRRFRLYFYDPCTQVIFVLRRQRPAALAGQSRAA